MLRRSPKFKVWKNRKGEWCVGNECFTMRATDEGARVQFNPSGKGCPADLREAYNALLGAAEAGKPTKYIKPSDEG